MACWGAMREGEGEGEGEGEDRQITECPPSPRISGIVAYSESEPSISDEDEPAGLELPVAEAAGSQAAELDEEAVDAVDDFVGDVSGNPLMENDQDEADVCGGVDD